MTEPGQDTGATSSSGSEASSDSGSAAEPQSGAYEAPPIEQSDAVQPASPWDYPGYGGPPPGYPAPNYDAPPNYQQPSYEQPSYPQQGYPEQPYAQPTYEAPPTYQPGGYSPPPPTYGAPYSDPSGYVPPGYPGAQYGTPPPPPYGAAPGYPPVGYGAPYGAPATSALAPGTNPMAVASLATSLVGLFLGIPLSLLCFIGFIPPFAGIALGCIALSQLKQTPAQGRGLAIAGIAIGGLAFIPLLLAVVFYSSVLFS